MDQQLAFDLSVASSSLGPHNQVGQLFQSAREERGLTLDDVARALHIRKLYLAAIEQGDFSSLPGRVYVLGFTRKYAEFLELDFREVQRRLSLQDVEFEDIEVLDILSPVPGYDWKKYSLYSVVALVVAGMSYLFLSYQTPPENPVIIMPERAPEPFTEKGEEPVSAAAAQIPKAEILPLETQSSSQAEIKSSSPQVKARPVITFKAKQPTWLELRDQDGNLLSMRVLKMDEKFTLPEKSGLSLTIGNAGGVQVFKDGVLLPYLGDVGQVRKRLNVDEIFFSP